MYKSLCVNQTEQCLRCSWVTVRFVCGLYLHECDEQEKGVSSSPDLLVEEPGQKGENPILGGTTEKEVEKSGFKISLHSHR